MAASSRTRLQIVQLAVAKAGRGPEYYAQGKDLLNLLLRDLAVQAKYPVLRKIGSQITLLSGTSTLALPTDIGAGSDYILFGTENQQMDEKSAEEFLDRGGIPASTTANARPCEYMVDWEAGVFRFNRVADQSYPLIPVYFKLPADIADTSAGDAQTLWYQNDATIISGLLWQIYQDLGDSRENLQLQAYEKAKARDLLAMVPMQGGSSRLRLAPSRFRYRQ